jgi:hypothetical protein
MLFIMRAVFLLVVVVFAAGCSTAHQQCELWQKEGFMYATPESCVKCVKRLGSSNRDVIRGCALGLDSADLMNLK